MLNEKEWFFLIIRIRYIFDGKDVLKKLLLIYYLEVLYLYYLIIN